jgi:hypothetical protein
MQSVTRMIEPTTVFRKAERQVSCQINDEVAILDLDRSLYFGLEGVGVQIWESLEQPRSVAELCNSLLEAFDVSRAQCEGDVLQLVTSLQEEGLIEVVP